MEELAFEWSCKWALTSGNGGRDGACVFRKDARIVTLSELLGAPALAAPTLRIPASALIPGT